MKNVFNIFRKDQKEEVLKPVVVPPVKHKIAMMMPHSNEFMPTGTAFSILALSVPPGVSRTMTSKDVEPINEARNKMVQEVIKDEELTHILMIDPFIKLHPGTLWEILGKDADIVSIPCFSEYGKNLPNIYRMVDGKHEPHIEFDRLSDRYVEISATDPGCVLIKKEVFTKVAPWFVFEGDKSDMFSFTSRAHALGLKLLATRILCCHKISTVEITYNHFKEHRDYAEKKAQNAPTISNT